MRSILCAHVRLEDLRMAIPLDRIIEVTLRVDVMEVPGLALPFLGMVMHRARGVPVMSLRHRLGMELRAPRLEDHFLFLRTMQGHVAIEVDRVEDMQEVDVDAIEAPPEGAPLTVGLAWIGERLVLVTDPDAIFAPEHRRDFEAALERIAAPS